MINESSKGRPNGQATPILGCGSDKDHRRQGVTGSHALILAARFRPTADRFRKVEYFPFRGLDTIPQKRNNLLVVLNLSQHPPIIVENGFLCD
jgi:hypothetical protein